MDTYISLSHDLKARIEREANVRGISFSEFVRESLEWAIVQKPLDDPLFSDNAVYCDDGAVDFASNHDDYLYGEAS